MTPEQLAKSGTESGEQRALFAAANKDAWQWHCQQCNNALPTDDGEMYRDAMLWDGVDRAWAAPLVWLHSIPNGGSRGDDACSRSIRGATMKAEGVKEGIPDVFMPCPRGRFAGLYIEMKKRGITKASPEQNEFARYSVSVGYDWHLCDTWQKAYAVLVAYLKS